MNTTLNAKPYVEHFILVPDDNHRLAAVCGECDQHLRFIERQLHVNIHNRGGVFQVMGNKSATHIAAHLLKTLYEEADRTDISSHHVHLSLERLILDTSENTSDTTHVAPVGIKTKHLLLQPKGENQQNYLQAIQSHDISFGIGPAGTGKTYLAVACAVQALEQDKVRRIMLVRPAVEAGEHLGFLPGDLAQKVDPYLRPLYDALYDMLGFERMTKLMERQVIEVAPLAFMRGRTLNDAFIILDESQNTTPDQMKMFLTRIGFHSKAVITGDMTQVDLPKGKLSGLQHAKEVLKDIPGISFTLFDAHDVVRHPLVKKIVQAYDKAAQQGQTHENES